MTPVFELQRLRRDHEAAVLDFELTNRAYFADSISDRGEDFFAEFAERYRALLAEQDAGICVFHLLVDTDGKVAGRFNLYDLVDGTAVVGFRVARHVAGRGVATSALLDLCRIAREEYGLQTLKAAASHENVASQRVLAKSGFVRVGPARVGGRHGAWYERSLTRG